ncbi:MAG: proprotein convertase P-domain-containing protein [Planctomycetota bacterium]
MMPVPRKACAPIVASLLAFPCAHAETVVFELDQPSAIPDGGAPVALFFSYDTPQRVVTGARLELGVTHEWVGDLVVSVRTPDGAVLRVLDRPGTVPAGFPGPWGCGGDDIDATFTDDATRTVTDACSIDASPVYAGDIAPEEPFGALIGVDPAGGWVVSVRDAQTGDAGTLDSLRLVLEVKPDCDLDGTPDACSVCLGDFDKDGDVDLGDFGVFGGAFGSSAGDAAYDGRADFDTDGDVDLGDFGVFGGEFGRADCSE